MLSRIEPAFGGTHPFPYAHTAWRPRARPNPVPRPPCPSKLESGPRVIRSCCPSTKLINPIRTSTSRRVPTRGSPTSDIQYSVVLSYPRRRTKSPRPPRSSVMPTDVRRSCFFRTCLLFFFLARSQTLFFWNRLGALSCESLVARFSNVPTSKKLWLKLEDKWRPGDERKRRRT